MTGVMRKAVTENPALYNDPNAVVGYEQHALAKKKAKKESRSVLKQWYGMKRQVVSEETKEDLELLKYRNFLDKDNAHLAPQKSSSRTDFFEMGFFSDVGKKRRRKFRSFADEWKAENTEIAEQVRKRVARDVKSRRREQARAKNRSAANKAKKEATTKRGRKRSSLSG